MGDRWVILWAASLALLRAVGHALKNVDAEADEKVRAAVDHAWRRWNTDRERHRIFWEFIDNVRNSILKEFELNAGQGVIARPGGDHTVTYPVYLKGFEEYDQIELLDASLQWWRDQLDVIEAEASASE